MKLTHYYIRHICFISACVTLVYLAWFGGYSSINTGIYIGNIKTIKNMNMVTQIPDCLKGYSSKQTLEHQHKSTVEIDGLEFAVSFVLDNPYGVARAIERERERKSELEKLKCALADRANKYRAGAVTSSVKAVSEPEPIIPLDLLHRYMNVGQGLGKQIQAIVMTIYNCMANKCTSTAYYSSKEVKDVKGKFVKALEDLRIPNTAYCLAVADEIGFVNGSRIVFVSSMVCGDFHIIAPTEPINIGMDLARAETLSAYKRYGLGIWNP